MKILITSASRKVPLIQAMQSAARRIDPAAIVVAGDVDPSVVSKFVADEFWLMPQTTDSDVQTLVQDCLARSISIILPTRDGELLFWSRHKAQFAAVGISIILSSTNTILLCLDKLAFSDWGTSRRLPTIPSALEPTGEGPFVVKERYGAGSKGVGLKLDRAEALAHAATLTEPIYQPWVEGSEISIDAWMTQTGRVHGLVLRRRDRVLNGESQVTTTFRDAEIESHAQSFLEALDLSGPVVMQVLVTDRTLSIIEVNARFGGASTASIPVGLDLLYWSILAHRFLTTPLPAFDRRVGDVRQVRVAQDLIFYDPDL